MKLCCFPVGNDSEGDITYVLGRQYQLIGDKHSAEAAFARSKMLWQQSNERANNKFNEAEKK